MNKSVIITGSTGMVGKGVLLECLDSSDIDKVLIINRSSISMNHPKLTEILLSDFNKIGSIRDQLKGYDACFYCMGISALGLSQDQYNQITYEITKLFVDLLFALNPNMTFNYVSGQGTDSSQKSRTMWARVKGKTENMVFEKGFKIAHAFRPGFILPEKGIKSKTGWYNTIYAILRPFFPLFKKSKSITTTTKIGKAMINSILYPVEERILHNKDINNLAE